MYKTSKGLARLKALTSRGRIKHVQVAHVMFITFITVVFIKIIGLRDFVNKKSARPSLFYSWFSIV